MFVVVLTQIFENLKNMTCDHLFNEIQLEFVALRAAFEYSGLESPIHFFPLTHWSSFCTRAENFKI